jgi:DNA-binding CsgD family transcriptional regulator
VAAAVVTRQDSAVVFAHPLIRSVVAEDAPEPVRRAAHRRLATVVNEREARARHLALAASGPDESVAGEVEQAALIAAGRGACDTAATLAALAVSLTPAGADPDHCRRTALEAEYRFESSDVTGACALLTALVDSTGPGPVRAELLRRLARYLMYRGDRIPSFMSRLTTALDECGGETKLRTAILLDLALAAANAGDEDTAIRYGTEALEFAVLAGDTAAEARLCAGWAFAAFIGGQGIRRDLIERGLGADQPHLLPMELRPNVAVGHLLHWADDLDGARVLYEREHARATAEGVETGLPLMLWGLVETEVWAGNWDRAEQLSAIGCELAEDSESSLSTGFMASVRGLVNVYRGRLVEGRRDAERAAELARTMRMPQIGLSAMHVLGLAALSVGDMAAVHAHLAPAATEVARAGVLEPGMVRFVPDEVEALIRLGSLDPAADLLATFASRSTELSRRWGIAAAMRCQGLLQAARGDLTGAADVLDTAVTQSRQLGMPFELARTLLVAAEVHRRARHKHRAHDSVEAARTIFRQLGAPQWEQRSIDEGARLGLRVPGPRLPAPVLTLAERQVADLAAGGMTNPEIAAALFMAQRTVESHLYRVYRKLAVRSRTQLARIHPTSPS